MLRPVFAATALLLTSLAQAAEPRPYHAEYEAYAYGQRVGAAERNLERIDANWRLSLSSEASLLLLSNKREEVSDLHYGPAGWQSLSYRYREDGTKTKQGAQRFDWQAMQASGDKEGRPWQLALSGPAYDQASYPLQLAHDLAAGKTAFDYELVHRGRLKHYHFERTGEEVLDTPAGKLNTVRLEKPAKAGDDESTVIWLAPTLDYVPVRIQHMDGGKPQAELRLVRFQAE